MNIMVIESELKKLKNDNEIMRKALEKIAYSSDHGLSSSPPDVINAMARKALDDTK